MLSEEEINKIARKVIELRTAKEPFRVYPSTLIKQKYHEKIYKKFGATGIIEDAIRVVATYKCGARRLSEIPLERHVEFGEYMEQLYKEVLGDEETENA